jgi:hypothetical protein
MSIELTEQQQAEWEKDRLRSLVFTAAEIKSALIELFGKPFNHTLLPEHKPDCPLILKPDDGAICHCFQEYQRQMTTGFIYLLHPLFRRTVLEAWEKYSLNNTPQLKKYLIREIVNEIMNYRPIKIASVSSVDYAIKLGNPTATKGTSFEEKAVALMGGRTEIRVVATVNVKVGGKIHPKGEQFDIPVDRWLRHEWLTACRLTESGPEDRPIWTPVGPSRLANRANRVRRLLSILGRHTSPKTRGRSSVCMTALCDELKVCRTGKGYLALREQLRTLCELRIVVEQQRPKQMSFRLLRYRHEPRR